MRCLKHNRRVMAVIVLSHCPFSLVAERYRNPEKSKATLLEDLVEKIILERFRVTLRQTAKVRVENFSK